MEKIVQSKLRKLHIVSQLRLEFYPPRKPVTPLAFVTMAKDEAIFLEAWIRNGLSICSDASFYIIDHASSPSLDQVLTNIPADACGRVSFIKLPGIAFDDDFKAMAVSSIAKLVLQAHEVVVSSDCDELLIGNDVGQNEILDIIMDSPEIICPIGFEFVQHLGAESGFDPRIPLREQRRFGFFASGYSKPVIWRRRTEFGAGLHRCRDDFRYETRLLLGHLRSVDHTISEMRAAQRRTMQLSDEQVAKGRAAYWHKPAEQKINFFERLISSNIQNYEFVMSGFIEAMRSSYKKYPSGFWGHDITLTTPFCSLA